MNTLAPWWRKPAPSVLGLDLQSSGIRLVELSRAVSGDFQVQTCGSLPCAPGWMVQGHVHAFEEMAQGLRQLIQACGAASRDVVLGLPASCVMTRTIHVDPCATDPEVLAAVQAAVARWLPDPVNDLIVDHCRLDDHDEAGQQVLVAVSRRDPVQDRVGLAEAAGLRTLAVDLEVQASGLALTALAQVSPRWQALSALVLLEVETEGAHLQWLESGELLKEADFTFPQTRHVGRPESVDEQQKVQALVQWTVAQLAAPSPLMAGPWPDARSDAWVDALVVAGSGSLLAQVAQGVRRECAVPVHVADPFELAAEDPRRQGATQTVPAASYLRAFGLAIHGTLQ
ncbi:MAG: hypothetical protein EBS16_00840 [Betaproteobacteria bacterium]|nr:hypothetical protein [Betaproteobacteria bacterium]